MQCESLLHMRVTYHDYESKEYHTKEDLLIYTHHAYAKITVFHGFIPEIYQNI